LLADEPTTALDTSIQEEVLMLFRKFRDERGSAIAIITHDLGVVRRICERIVVMYAGSVVEDGPVADVFGRPAHPYTRRLVAIAGSNENSDPQRLGGEMPDPMNPPAGCPFHSRCPYARDHCLEVKPALRAGGAGHSVACHYYEDIQTGTAIERSTEYSHV
jgi:oligopeptide transport system ATP-binding protein